MSTPPAAPKIYHITHVSNLASIVADGGLHADAGMSGRGGPAVSIGMPHIKRDRFSCEVGCHPGSVVADYVPFNFCPRSVMLYIIHMANHPQLAYRDGQGPIVHLQADLRAAIRWAEANGERWAFTRSNARAGYAEFFDDTADLDKIPWEAVANNDFRTSVVKEAKQAEFLLHGTFPWTLVEAIGVRNASTRTEAVSSMLRARHRPPVVIEPSWYF